MPIPPLSFEATVLAEGAKHDKIQIGIEGGSIFGETQDVRNFLNHLGSPPRAHRNARDIAPFGLYFSRPSEFLLPQDREPQFSQTIRDMPFQAGGRSHPAPLFTGKLEVKNCRNEEWRIFLRLSLNPSRFVRHQPMPSRSSLFHPQPIFPQFVPRLFKSDLAEPADEHAFMRCDNWVPNSRSWQQFASEAFWPDHLRNCLTILPQRLIAELGRSAELMHTIAPTAHLQAQWHFNLHSVETYWEFLCDDPLEAVQKLHQWVERFAQPVPSSHEPDDERQYSRILRRATRNGEILKIYAKTDRRIRFEVVHQLRGNNGFRVPRGGHTFSSIAGMFPLLNQLTQSATEPVNDVLRHFRRNATAPDCQHTVLKLIADFQAACRNPDRALQLLQILTCEGWIDVGKGINVGKVYSGELRRLRDAGIMVSSHHRYSVTPSYRQALENMRQTGVGFLLGTRIRRKHSLPNHS